MRLGSFNRGEDPEAAQNRAYIEARTEALAMKNKTYNYTNDNDDIIRVKIIEVTPENVLITDRNDNDPYKKLKYEMERFMPVQGGGRRRRRRRRTHRKTRSASKKNSRRRK
jgi:hypothetical protein